MATVQPEQIQYYGGKDDGLPDFEKATCRIREKVRMYYENHQTEIMRYAIEAYQFVLANSRNAYDPYSKNDNCTLKGAVPTTKNTLTMGVFAYS